MADAGDGTLDLIATLAAEDAAPLFAAVELVAPDLPRGTGSTYLGAALGEISRRLLRVSAACPPGDF